MWPVGRARCSLPDVTCATAFAAGFALNCAGRGSGACGSSTRSGPRTTTSSKVDRPLVPETRPSSHGRCCVGHESSGRVKIAVDGSRSEGRSHAFRAARDRRPTSTVARDTSFYYSFLVLPPDKRRAIIAVWDFCRAVDDAVDESGRRAGWASGSRRGGEMAGGAGALFCSRRHH